jgi:hypothetical protein
VRQHSADLLVETEIHRRALRCTGKGSSFCMVPMKLLRGDICVGIGSRTRERGLVMQAAL